MIKDRCLSEVTFDYCGFYCHKPKGHEGRHEHSGTIGDRKFTVTWTGDDEK